ncbi:MAG: hypothetical protein CMQ19_12720 [Gammaproteobacteria bacterium]|nr:hypothetical protein [Gammaproteobacteria bacterium]
MEKIFQQAEEAGLNLSAVFDLSTLPAEIVESILASYPGALEFESLALLGSYGSRYWHYLGQVDERERHPVDEYVISQVQDIFSQFQFQILYPGDHLLPLVGLGQLAGWHHTSPLGIGLHPDYGPWYAYRAVFLVNGIGPLAKPVGSHSCAACASQSCLSVCPGGAVRLQGFDVSACSQSRIQVNSPCTETCASRLACPVGRVHQYTPEQIQYHYRHSLDGLRG